jgi:hypothetical protein
MTRNQTIQVAAAGGMLLLACTITAARLLGSGSKELRAPDVLIVEATRPGDAESDQLLRHKAARELVAQAAEATEMLRQLAAESDDPTVRATALQGLGKARDNGSALLLVEMLEHQDPRVRGQANAALVKLYQCDLGFRAHDEPQKRATATAQWRAAIRQGAR